MIEAVFSYPALSYDIAHSFAFSYEAFSCERAGINGFLWCSFL